MKKEKTNKKGKEVKKKKGGKKKEQGIMFWLFSIGSKYQIRNISGLYWSLVRKKR